MLRKERHPEQVHLHLQKGSGRYLKYGRYFLQALVLTMLVFLLFGRRSLIRQRAWLYTLVCYGLSPLPDKPQLLLGT